MSMYRYHHIMVCVYVYDTCVCIHHVQNTYYTDVWYIVYSAPYQYYTILCTCHVTRNTCNVWCDVSTYTSCHTYIPCDVSWHTHLHNIHMYVMYIILLPIHVCVLPIHGIWYVVSYVSYNTPLYVYVSIYTSHVMCIDIHIHVTCVCIHLYVHNTVHK